MTGDDDRLWVGPLLVIAAIATVSLHVFYVPRYFPERLALAMPVLLVGWLTYCLVFYLLGRLVAPSQLLPNMRAIDVGLGLVLLSVVLIGLFDTAGVSIRTFTLGHLLLAPGIYVGLALLGWGLGRRTAAVNRIAARTD